MERHRFEISRRKFVVRSALAAGATTLGAGMFDAPVARARGVPRRAATLASSGVVLTLENHDRFAAATLRRIVEGCSARRLQWRPDRHPTAASTIPG
jgi:hypothetical protein